MNTKLKHQGTLSVIIAGGGTGGHVFPAIAIATSIKKKVHDVKILFVGARGRMEMQKVPEAGFHIIGLDIAGLQRNMSRKNLLLPFKLCKSLNAAKIIVKRFKPDIVIGVGGYAGGPLLWAAAKQNVPVLIQEQNSYPGLTNRILAKKAEKICVAFEGMEKYFPEKKIYITGNPVREDIINIENKRQEALEQFGFSNKKPVLLVTGGSLGARTINQSIAENLSNLLEKNIQVIWQTGKLFYEQAISMKNNLKHQHALIINEFIDRMDYAYAAADVVVSRAGAIAVSELCAVRKPAILVPSPNVAEDHQTKNAMALVNRHAAIMVNDSDARKTLANVITDLIFDEDKKQQLKEKMAGLSYKNSANIIAEIALNMAEN